MKTEEKPIGKFINKLELPENIKKGIKILTWVIPIIIFSLVVYAVFFESAKNKRERDIKSTLEYNFKGKVKEKYISWNHNTPTTKLYGGKEIGSDYGLYNFVQINDSVLKEKGVLYVKVYRKESDTSNYTYFDKEYFNVLDRKNKID